MDRYPQEEHRLIHWENFPANELEEELLVPRSHRVLDLHLNPHHHNESTNLNGHFNETLIIIIRNVCNLK